MADAAAVEVSDGSPRFGALLIALVATIALWLPANARAADVGTGAAFASEGIAVDGLGNTASKMVWFDFTFVVPTGTCVDGELVPGVNLCEPWAALAVSDHDRPQDPAGATANCSTLTNPMRWSGGHPVTDLSPARDKHPTLKPLSGIYADVRCDDGSGYDFYRVVVDDKSDASGPWGLFDDRVWGTAVSTQTNAFTMTWGDYKGIVDVGSSNGALEVIRMRVYGHYADGSSDLLVRDGGGRAYPAASRITTTVAGVE